MLFQALARNHRDCVLSDGIVGVGAQSFWYHLQLEGGGGGGGEDDRVRSIASTLEPQRSFRKKKNSVFVVMTIASISFHSPNRTGACAASIKYVVAIGMQCPARANLDMERIGRLCPEAPAPPIALLPFTRATRGRVRLHDGGTRQQCTYAGFHPLHLPPQGRAPAGARTAGNRGRQQDKSESKPSKQSASGVLTT